MSNIYINNLNIINVNQNIINQNNINIESNNKKKRLSLFRKRKEPVLTYEEAKKYCKEFVCPCCGETRDWYFDSNELKGLSRGGIVTDENGDSFFDCNLYHRLIINCYTCDHKFETPRFQYNK